MLLARADVKKSRWIASGCDDFHLLGEAIKHYSRCSLITGNVEAAINTATLMLLGGREEEAHERAEEIALRCRKLIMEGDVKKESYLAVVIAEVHMINGRFHHAETWYKTAFANSEAMPDHVLTNMNLLLEHHVPDTVIVLRIRKAVGA